MGQTRIYFISFSFSQKHCVRNFCIVLQALRKGHRVLWDLSIWSGKLSAASTREGPGEGGLPPSENRLAPH